MMRVVDYGPNLRWTVDCGIASERCLLRKVFLRAWWATWIGWNMGKSDKFGIVIIIGTVSAVATTVMRN